MLGDITVAAGVNFGVDVVSGFVGTVVFGALGAVGLVVLGIVDVVSLLDTCAGHPSIDSTVGLGSLDDVGMVMGHWALLDLADVEVSVWVAVEAPGAFGKA